MSDFHLVWLKQCRAAEGVRERWGVKKALGYLVGEKLLNHMKAAEDHPDFAAELPKFVAEVRRMFDREPLESYLDGLRRVGAHGHILDDGAFEEARGAGMFEEDVVDAAEDVIRIGRIRDMLLGWGWGRLPHRG